MKLTQNALFLLTVALFAGSIGTTHAASGTWTGGPLWSDAANWTGVTAPGAADTATFDGQGTSSVDLEARADAKYFSFSGSKGYTLGLDSSQVLGIGGWPSMTLTASNFVDQTIAATVDLVAHAEWKNISTNSLIVNGDFTSTTNWNMWFTSGKFSFNGTNNTRAGGTRIDGGAEVTAGSWNSGGIEMYHGAFIMNFDATRNLDVSRADATGDWLYGIGANNTITLPETLNYWASTNIGNVGTITGGTIDLNGDWRNVEVQDNAAVTGPELIIESDCVKGDTYSGNLTKKLPGTLRLTGNNSGMGILTIHEGTVQVDASGFGGGRTHLGTAAVETTLEFIGDTPRVFTPGVRLNSDAGVNQTILANGDAGAPFTITFIQGNGNGDTLTLGGTNMAANTIDTDLNTFKGLAGGLTKSGTGTWVLGADQTYSGPTAVQAGRLDLDGDLTSEITVAGGATLAGDGSTTSNMVLGVSGSATLVVDGSTSDASGSSADLTTTGGVDIVIDVAGPDPITVLNYGTWTGTIGDFSLAGGSVPIGPRGGTGNFTDAGGSITIDMGYEGRTWAPGDPTNPTWWDINTSLNWAEDDKKFLDSDAVTFGDTGAGTVAIQTAVAPLSVMFNNTTNVGAYVLNGSAVSPQYKFEMTGEGNVTVHSVIGGDTVLLKTSTSKGVLALNAANTYSGDTKTEAGKIAVNHSGAFGGGSVTLEDGDPSGTPEITLANGVVVTNDLTVSGAGEGGWKRLQLTSGSTNYAVWAGDITSTEDWVNDFKVGARGAGQTLELAGDITAPAMQIFQCGLGTVYLTGSNTFSGTVHVRNWGSNLRLGNDNAVNGALVSLDELTSLQLDDGVDTPASATLEIGALTANPKTVEVLDQDSGVDESASIMGDIDVRPMLGSFNVVVQDGDALTFGGDMSGTGSVNIVKSGGGEVAWNGANSYTGGQYIAEAGTTWINGNGDAATNLLAVNVDAKLGGRGSWGGDITLSNGADVVYSLLDNLGQSGFDALADVTFGGSHDVTLRFDGTGSAVSWTNAFWETKQTLNLLDVDGTLSGAGGLALVPENWTDSEGQSLQSVRNKAKFLLQVLPQEVNLLYIAPPAPGVVFVVR